MTCLNVHVCLYQCHWHYLIDQLTGFTQKKWALNVSSQVFGQMEVGDQTG